MSTFEQQVAEAQMWCESPRFSGLRRLYSARSIAEQQGTIANDYTVARNAAEAFYARLRRALRRAQADHDVRSVLAGPGRRDEADGHRGHLPRRMGDVGQGLDAGRPWTGPRELSA